MATINDELEEFDTDHDSVDEPGFASRLRQLVALSGTASALAKKAGISQGGLSRDLTGGDPSRRVLLALARATGVEVAWLACGEGPMMKSEISTASLQNPSLKLLPYYAPHENEGGAVPADQQDFTAQAFCSRWLGSKGLNSRHLAVMQVSGNGMSPTLNSGDTTMIDTASLDIEDGRIYLIEDAGNLLLRRLQIEIGGQLRVLADNPSHREFIVPAGQITVLGRVVWRGALL